jgi:hypothetical protein
MLKLRAALPPSLSRQVGRVRDRFHLDAGRLVPGDRDQPAPGRAGGGAVWDSRRVRLTYERHKHPRRVERLIERSASC